MQKALGHSDLAATMGYSHLLDADLLALVEELSLEELKEVASGL